MAGATDNGAAWDGLRLSGRLTGGSRVTALLGTLRGKQVVIRRSTRPAAAVDWEMDLLAHLADSGIRVPQIVPADDGRRHVDGWHVYAFVEGRPAAQEDMSAVENAVATVHTATREWPQRPGFRSARELLTERRGGDIDLSTMPTDLVALLRRAWADVSPRASGVVHGDLGPGNAILGDRGEVTLIDWDESRVDDPGFDVGSSPGWRLARVAWEVATCWHVEPAYAARVADQFRHDVADRARDAR